VIGRTDVELDKNCKPDTTQELRQLDGAEVDDVSGGALWLVPLIMTVALATYLASQRKDQ
jgi:hypothetical protein